MDDFQHEGPNGNHACLVFELMGETLRSFGVWFKECMVATTIMRRFSWQLVVALDFAHASGVIHTGKLFGKHANYRVQTGCPAGEPLLHKIPKLIVIIRHQARQRLCQILDKSQIKHYLANEVIPQQDRTKAQYTPILSSLLRRYYFNTDPGRFNDLNITLGDWGVSSWTTKHLTENMQPVALQAPEVLIKALWDNKADFWNLGAVLFEVYRAIRLFDGRVGPDGHYELKKHLSEIVSVFGPFPKDLLEKGDPEIVKGIFNEEGKVDLEGPGEYPPLGSEEFLPDLDPETREVSASFLRFIMKVNPADRPTPGEMVEHPWLTPKWVLKGP